MTTEEIISNLLDKEVRSVAGAAMCYLRNHIDTKLSECVQRIAEEEVSKMEKEIREKIITAIAAANIKVNIEAVSP
jgi:hypothetical protein